MGYLPWQGEIPVPKLYATRPDWLLTSLAPAASGR
jgi:hypothetical protein